MVRTILFGAAIMAGMFAFGGAAQAEVEKGTCSVMVSTHGGKKFALMKCAAPSLRGEGSIRMQVWEKDDAKQFRALSRYAGRRFSCDLRYDGLRRDGGYQFGRYTIMKCR